MNGAFERKTYAFLVFGTHDADEDLDDNGDDEDHGDDESMMMTKTMALINQADFKNKYN